MSEIDQMPSKCKNCPYWEISKEPYCCGDCSMELYYATLKQLEDRNAK